MESAERTIGTLKVKKVLLIKYGEIALRKGNRGLFERKLVETIRGLIGDSEIRTSREQGRLVVEDTRGDIEADLVIEKIRRVFGVTAICICMKLEQSDIASLHEVALSVMSQYPNAEKLTFKVETKRADKNYPMQSREVSASVGEYIFNNIPGIAVDLHNPDVTLWVEIRTKTYIYTNSVKGEAGLPYGSSGKGVLLLSGGIDSPVAGYLMARRGMEIVPVYFHSPPYTSERALEKVMDLVKQLSAFTGILPLYVVPFTETQLYIYERMPEAKMTLFLKRAMMRISCAIAEQEKAHCLITGDSIGQVASQTAHSVAAVDSASSHAVLRPLAAMDKQQIINTAIQIGTYEISIQPYEDCCTVFVPKHPEHKPSAKAVADIESRHKTLLELYDKAFAETQKY